MTLEVGKISNGVWAAKQHSNLNDPQGEPVEGASPFQNKNISPVQNQNISLTLLMGMTTVCAFLSIIAPLRLGAALALRGVALLSVSLADTPDKFEAKTVKAAKIAAVVMGLVGLAAALPVLLIASLGVDMGVQFAGFIRHLYEGNYVQATTHLAVLIIDSLALAGLVLGSWEFMVASMSVTAALMFAGGFASICSNRDGDDEGTRARKIFTAGAFMMLAAISMTGAITTSEIRRDRYDERVTVKHKDPLGMLSGSGLNLPVAESDAIVGWTQIQKFDDWLEQERKLWEKTWYINNNIPSERHSFQNLTPEEQYTYESDWTKYKRQLIEAQKKSNTTRI